MSVHPVPEIVTEGLEIKIIGVVNPDCDRFSINLCVGEDDDSDKTLHFNPRFDQTEVVRNHFSDGWGDEERDGGFPFRLGEPCDIRIVVHGSHYEIHVNGTYFCEFRHRLPKEGVRTVVINGGFSVQDVSFSRETTIEYPPVPLTAPIPGTLTYGRRITISGVPHGDPQRFSVNLMTGPDFDSSDLALHFDARFNFGNTQNQTVRTSKIGGHFGDEERAESSFPFAPNTPFEMVIVVSDQCYTMMIDNLIHSTFTHRNVRPEHVNHICIRGDVDLRQVRFN